MNKNEKGFTLIELLVTIALMLSILGIAIVSFVNVSSKKKEEAWQGVKSSIETAAIEYFTANEYLFTGLSNGTTGTITVGKLVGEDYLNKITNPVTGKSISYCSLVRVTKTNNNKYDAIFDEGTKESEENCVSTNNNDPNNNDPNDNDPTDYIVITEPGAPSGEIKYFDETGKPLTNDYNWFNSENLGENGALNVCINAYTNSQGPIVEATMDGESLGLNTINGEDYYCKTIEESVELDDVEFSLMNSSEKKWFTTVDKIKKDSTPPEGTMSLSSQNVNYNTNVADAYIETSDDFSGVSRVEVINHNNTNDNFTNSNSGQDEPYVIEKTFTIQGSHNGGKQNIDGWVTDVAGNTAEISVDDYYVYNMCSEVTPRQHWYSYYSDCPEGCIDDTSCGCKIEWDYYWEYYDTYFSNQYCSNKTNPTTPSNSPKCYKTSSLTYEGTKGDNGWYTSNVKVKKDGKLLCTITKEGTKSKCEYKIGNISCNSGAKKIDKTKPKMTINSGPKKGSCRSSRAITTKWTATDNLSGIAVEKDYYGYDSTYDFSFADRLVDRGCNTGTKKCTYTHTWGPNCYSVGNPGKGNCYKLKWYLKDKAGNENKGMSSNCYKW